MMMVFFVFIAVDAKYPLTMNDVSITELNVLPVYYG